MYLLLMSTAALCIIVIFVFKYLSLLRWVSGHAYVLSKQQEHFSIVEMLDLFKNVKPFPISCQKGWKIDSYANGHRVWFSFLTFPDNLNAPSIKVYAAFNLVQSTSQALLKVLKNVSQFCEWKPGVITASNTYNTASPEVIEEGLPSQAVQIISVKEEILCNHVYKFGMHSHDSWFTENVAPTMMVEYKRIWHKEENGVCWLLQMNELLQTCEFYLIQPVQEMNQSLVSVVTWSREHLSSSTDRASVLLSSLMEYISLRNVQSRPITEITSPLEVSDKALGKSSSGDDEDDSIGPSSLLSSKNKQIYDSSSSRSTSTRSRRSNLDKYYILRYKYRKASSSVSPSTSRSSTASFMSDLPDSDLSSFITPEDHVGACFSKDPSRNAIRRTVSDGVAAKRNLIVNQAGDVNIEDDDDDRTGHSISCVPENEDSVSEDMTIAHFKTLSSQCASELLAEAMQASEINLELPLEKQAESSGGWIFSSYDKNIVVLKKVQRNGTTVQSCMGKGFLLASPRAVWDAVRNPHTRFTYDDTLKKVDIISTIDRAHKIVHFYHESQQLLMKESCDVCVLQGERLDGSRYILSYSSIDHDKCPSKPGIIRAKVLASGWIIEPARQDNRVYSLVTYITQIDFGHGPDGCGSLPFQDMIAHYPFSIADLQQYLRMSVQLMRHKSVA